MGRRLGLLVLLCCGAVAALVGVARVSLADAVHAGSGAKADGGVGAMTTAEHLRQAEWWPTKAGATGYVGDRECARCHAGIAREQATSQMAHTLTRADEAVTLREHVGASYRNGAYGYVIRASTAGPEIAVTKGGETRTAWPMWAFGSGEVGQSYLWETAGVGQESRFNFFASLGGLAATPGRLAGEPASMDEAVGRAMSAAEQRSCFSCHVTGFGGRAVTAGAEVHFEEAGVHCEACHGPGAEHVAAARAAHGEVWDAKILNAARLSPVGAVEACGACHSTPWDVRVMGAAGVQTVRFPAYRLEKSHCWRDKGDVRLECTGCHDPHAPLERQAVAYDTSCLGCHVNRAGEGVRVADAEHEGKACPVATKACVTCHMPKIAVAEMHSTFTDHEIRVVRAGERFPD